MDIAVCLIGIAVILLAINFIRHINDEEKYREFIARTVLTHPRFYLKLDKDAFEPVHAHEEDAGYDIISPIDVDIEPRQSAVIDTGVHILIPEGYVGMLKSKSGLNVKSSITGTGTIDALYTGSIIVKLYNNGDEKYSFHRGDKLIQIVFLPIETPELEKNLTAFYECDSARGDNGFGSTGK